MKRLAFLVIGIILGISTIFLALWLSDLFYQYNGSLIEPAVQAPEISLTNQDGQPWVLKGQKGKAVIIFFGYTSCPDVCPTTLSLFRQMKELLGKQADNVDFVYITVDPERDTPEKLKANLAAFDSEFIGLTGSIEELEPVWKSYGVFHQKVETESASGYLMDHSATTYVINPDGDLRLTYPFGMDVGQIVDDIKHLLKD